MAEIDKAWYVKYRPKTMKEYAGSKIRKVVEQRFRVQSEMPHVILIHGTRGCGKTTFARIISKYYQCENPNEDGTPCECCETCQAINETLISGETDIETPGIVEVDATTANGKEAIQEVIEDAMIEPMYTKYKVIIFDECHMITPQAQNSLLKIIEDIPPHLVVIFATTNPEKVLDTIKSRCQLKLTVKKQDIKDMAQRLMYISEQEKLTVSQEALEVIAKKGDRVPRECINLLEQIAKQYDGEVNIENVRDFVGGASSDLYMDFFKAANTSLEDVLNMVAKLKEQSIEIDKFMSGLLEFVMDSMFIKHGINIEDYPVEYVASVKKLFSFYESQDFDMLMQILEQANRSIKAGEESKNEVALTLCAMRIGKIQLLAKGLADAQDEAISENKISLVEHSKMIKDRHEEVSEQLKMEITPALMKESFDEVSIVQDNLEIQNTPDLGVRAASTGINLKIDKDEYSKMSEKSSELQTPDLKTNSEIEDFFKTE